MEQGAIGSKHGLEAFLPRDRDKLWQEWMQQRLSHKMEIEKTNLAPEFVCEQVELFESHLSLRPVMLRAEVAVEVASVRYLYVTAIYHFYSMLGVHTNLYISLGVLRFSTSNWKSLPTTIPLLRNICSTVFLASSG